MPEDRSEGQSSPFAPPQSAAGRIGLRVASRSIGLVSLLIPYVVLPLLVKLADLVPAGPAWSSVQIVLVLPAIPITASLILGVILAKHFNMFLFRYLEWLVGFYVVTLLVEYVTIFDWVYPNFSWR